MVNTTNDLLFCAAKVNDDGKVYFESIKSNGLTLSQTIEDDKKYGIMKPANDQYFTFTILNEDQEFTQRQALLAMRYAYKKWAIYANLPKFKWVPKDYRGIIDFRLEFRTVDGDPDKKLTENTIMYHYYPIRLLTNAFRGLCVVNKKFFFTSHGNSVFGKEMQRHGVPVQYPDKKYRTIDFDTVYAHEFGHGIGLPHDTEPDSIMSTPYNDISEMPSMRDQSRVKAKYGHKHMPSWILKRWIKILNIISDR